MNSFRALLFSSAIFAVLIMAAAVQPAVAQQDQPHHVFHRGIPAGKTCVDCHKAIYDQWQASPHAANGIECTVCHNDPASPEFSGMPALSTCSNCHAEQVAQLKSDSFMQGKTCVSCHQAHVFAEHKKAAAPAGN